MSKKDKLLSDFQGEANAPSPRKIFRRGCELPWWGLLRLILARGLLVGNVRKACFTLFQSIRAYRPCLFYYSDFVWAILEWIPPLVKLYRYFINRRIDLRPQLDVTWCIQWYIASSITSRLFTTEDASRRDVTREVMHQVTSSQNRGRMKWRLCPD